MAPANDKLIRRFHIGMIILTAFLCVVGLILLLTVRIVSDSSVYGFDVSINLYGMILAMIFQITLCQEKHPGHAARAMIQLFSFCALGMFSDLFVSVFDDMADMRLWLTFFHILYYTFATLITSRFFFYVLAEFHLDKKIYRVLYYIILLLSVAYIISLIINVSLPFYYYVDEFGSFIRLNAFYAIYATPELIAVISLITGLIQKTSLAQKVSFLSYILIPIAAAFLQTINDDLSLHLPAVLISILLIYNTVYLERSRLVLEQESRLVKQSTALMISQIQPHFLYNTLTTISNLCCKDPEEAEETTILFSQYLRTNLDSLRTMEPVPFTKEMDHIRVYLELEKKRFGDKLNVEYDIEDTAFTVPSLGLQPIAENSVKHGIRGKEEAGHLKISSRRIEKGHQVIIEDDGVGFDPAAPVKDDGRSHVGMQNVRDRLKNMCGAEMEITSSPGEGCRTVITFPDR